MPSPFGLALSPLGADILYDGPSGHFAYSTIQEKIFGTKWSNPVKLDRKRKVWYLFLCFLTAICKVYVLEGRLGTRLCAHPNLIFF